MWALLGGLLLSGIVLLTVASATGNLLFDKPFAGDFEMVEVGVAVAVFLFLPYCQISGANVTADIFTSWVGPRGQAVLEMLASLVALAFAAILLWRMSAGLMDYYEHDEITSIIGFPLWTAFIPILMSLALLVVAALVTSADALQRVRHVAGEVE
ncbi:MAG: TRAP transporter small permease [Gammaproteobacteria bacterium]|nr:TRAP transporter small permease [Gammaproteobacteria bacterium]